MTKRIITISREFGSGGRFIGEEVAKKLGIAYYDKNIINDIAEKSGLSPEYVQKNAELSPKKGLFAYAFAGRDITGKSVEDMVYEAQRKVILELAEKESCVIIGRNADYILKDRDNVLNVFIHGDMPEKTQRIMGLYNVEEKKAVKMMADTDKRRMANYNFYTDQKFTYGGVLVDIGDLYLNGNQGETHASNYLGNTHGGMLQIEDQWYIFYHRQTNRSSYARQACAEKLKHRNDGGFQQAEITSCGLNQGALKGIGSYEARIACNLWSINGTGRYDGKSPKQKLKDHPYFTQSGKDRENSGDQYIANMKSGSVAVFKYFEMGEANQIGITIQGNAKGTMQVSDKSDFENICAEIEVSNREKEMHTYKGALNIPRGKRALFFRFQGEGTVDFHSFELMKD